MTVDALRVWELLGEVADPEIPVISVVDLGIVRQVDVDAEGGVRVTLTPTYLGCPATLAIETAVHDALAAQFPNVSVQVRLAPAWTTDWITAQGRERLADYGIAPPERFADPSRRSPRHNAGSVEENLLSKERQNLDDLVSNEKPNAMREGDAGRPRACPRCGSTSTELLSAFGSTPCKALYRCLSCREPFDYFKCL